MFCINEVSIYIFRNDRDAPIKTRLEDCYKRYSLLKFCTIHSLYANEFIKMNKDTDAILMLIPHLKEAFIQKAYGSYNNQ